MGYDVSFHPISPEEMREWYFTPLTWIQQGQEEKVLALAAQHGMEDFYAEKYLNTLRVGAETESNELFDKSHGFYIAVIQGFFRDYYYTRGSAFSFLVEQKPEYARYFTSWEQITPVSFPNPMQNRIIENYCSGVYLSPDQVIQLLKDMEQDPKVLEDLEGLWSNGQIAVLKKALSAAAKSGVGLLEATEVVEPNPISPNESTSYSIGLKWSAFDFNHNCFSIRHTVTTCNVKGERVTIKKDKAKNKSSLRTYPLIPFLKERLLEAKKQQEENRKLCGRAYNKEYLGYVCVDVIGNLIKPNYVSSTFGKLLAKNNLRHIRFHDLRHTCASLLLANGVPMEQVKEWLGHSEISTTVDIYGHLQYATKKQSAAAIEQDIVAPMLQNLSAVSP